MAELEDADTWSPREPSFEYKNRPDYGRPPAQRNEVLNYFMLL